MATTPAVGVLTSAGSEPLGGLWGCKRSTPRDAAACCLTHVLATYRGELGWEWRAPLNLHSQIFLGGSALGALDSRNDSQSVSSVGRESSPSLS